MSRHFTAVDRLASFDRRRLVRAAGVRAASSCPSSVSPLSSPGRPSSFATAVKWPYRRTGWTVIDGLRRYGRFSTKSGRARRAVTPACRVAAHAAGARDGFSTHRGRRGGDSPQPGGIGSRSPAAAGAARRLFTGSYRERDRPFADVRAHHMPQCSLVTLPIRVCNIYDGASAQCPVTRQQNARGAVIHMNETAAHLLLRPISCSRLRRGSRVRRFPPQRRFTP